MSDAAVFYQSTTENSASVGDFSAPVNTNRFELSKRSAVVLLQKLSTDDAFRASYMANPRESLIGIGVSAIELPGNMPKLETLADKAVFEAALVQVREDLAAVYSCQQPPQLRFNTGA